MYAFNKDMLMSGPVPKKKLDKKTVEEWLSKASTRSFNIMNSDQNAIITHLCRTLLEMWEDKKR